MEAAEISANVRLPPSRNAAIIGVQSQRQGGYVQERRYKPTSAGRDASDHNFQYGRSRRIDIVKLNRQAQAAAVYPLPMDLEHDEF